MTDKILIIIEEVRTGLCRKFIQAARQFHLRPVMLSHDPAGIDYIEAEGVEAIQVDTTDINAVIDACEKLKLTRECKIVGATTASEHFYATAAKVCQHFGSPGPDRDAIVRCQDKFAQRQLLTGSNIPTPAYRLAKNAADATKFAGEIGLPVIVKPVVGTASSGVKLCRSLDEVAKHTDFLLAGKHGLPPRPTVLIEEFAQGPFYTVSTIGSEVVGISAAGFSELPYFTMRDFDFPARLNNDDYDRVADIAMRSLRALGLGWGPANTEIRMTSGGPVVIEVNPRIVGSPEPELIELAYGIDLFAETLKLFLYLKPDLHKSRSHVAAARFLMAEQDGVLERISGEREARAVPGITDVKLRIKAGTPLVWRGDSRDVIGHVFAASPSAERTDAALQQALDLIKLSVVPFSDGDDQERLVGTG